jgi:hypothetical protein
VNASFPVVVLFGPSVSVGVATSVLSVSVGVSVDDDTGLDVETGGPSDTVETTVDVVEVVSIVVVSDTVVLVVDVPGVVTVGDVVVSSRQWFSFPSAFAPWASQSCPLVGWGSGTHEAPFTWSLHPDPGSLTSARPMAGMRDITAVVANTARTISTLRTAPSPISPDYQRRCQADSTACS